MFVQYIYLYKNKLFVCLSTDVIIRIELYVIMKLVVVMFVMTMLSIWRHYKY